MDEWAIDLGVLYEDISACLVAFANALDSQGTLPRSRLAEAAQERLLQVNASELVGAPQRLMLLKLLATKMEGLENDLVG